MFTPLKFNLWREVSSQQLILVLVKRTVSRKHVRAALRLELAAVSLLLEGRLGLCEAQTAGQTQKHGGTM